MKRLFYSFWLILLSLHAPVFAKASEIVATLPPIAALALWLKPDADISCLLPANADPHHFQLSPRQIESLQQSKLLLRSSRDDGHWVSLNKHDHILDLWESHTPSHKHITNHAWLNPHEVQAILPKIAIQLQLIYPQDKQAIQNNLTLAIKQSEQIWDAWVRISQSTGLNQYGVMMQHPSWSNLFQALHIRIFNTLESEQHGHEHGPRKLESALQQLQQHPNIRLIADSNHSNRALQWLKHHHPSNTITTLDALGSCHETWLHLMQRNMNVLQP